MKIAISELKSPQTLDDLSPEAGGAIIGGETSASVGVFTTAYGDFSITQSDANSYTYVYENDYGKYSFSVAFGYGFGFSAEYK
jgi:hypothetical protein